VAYVSALRQQRHTRFVGHNPLGALSILAMLLILLLQVSSGLISDDEIAFSGPWAALAPGDWVSWATRYHKTWGKALLLGLVALHLLAIVVHRLRHHHNLVPAMWHGEQQAAAGTVASRDGIGTRVLALLILVACIGLVRWLMPGVQ
jgi:cytochrome b